MRKIGRNGVAQNTYVAPVRGAQPGPKKTFYKVGDGHIVGTTAKGVPTMLHHAHGSEVKLSERQAQYHLLAGRISRHPPQARAHLGKLANQAAVTAPPGQWVEIAVPAGEIKPKGR